MKMKKQLIGILLTLMMVLGQMPGMSLTALAWDGDPYASLLNTTTVVKFDDKDWYLIEDNSTAANAGTVTLLSKECVAASQYGSNTYSGSTVETAVNNYYTNSISSDVKSAIVDSKMFLLTTAQALAMTNAEVWKCSRYSGTEDNYWWLCSPGNYNGMAACVGGDNGRVYVGGLNVGYKLGVRPALKLNLESVIFSSESNEFTVSYRVTITAGSNMTKTETSGAASQTGLTGPMNDVVYTANEDYYFPENYSVSTVNGITVARNSYTQITVSGKPTADAEITLTAPTAKTTPDVPTTAAAENCTTADNNDGKLTGVTTAMEYKKSDAADWTAGTGSDITGLVPGTYYVRVKATETTNASTNQELTIKGFISYTVTFKVVNGKWNEGEGDAATADKTETLTGHDGDTLKLTADQIPAVGSKPNDTYKAGSWDTTPSADTAITADTTYIYTYAQKDTISRTVTFKVVNGSWDDETATDKTVTMTGYEGDTLKLAANQIPAVGTKPNDTYKAGSWNVTPSADTEITADTTYTYTYAQKDAISQTVTFKVVNGSWNDETATDKTVTLTGYEGDTLKLAASQIPAVGDKPGTNYKAGSWNVTPSAGTAITAATTYTYTYVAKEAAVVTKAPEGKTLTYNGQEQALVTAGEATGGEMQYALGNETEATQPYTTTIPTATNAGTYFVWYIAKGDANHADTAPAGPVTVVIASRVAAEYTLTVRYVYQDGTQAAEPHTEKLTEGSPYSVASPAIAGFTPDAASVSGVVGAADVNVTVTYTANPVADRTGKIELHGLDAVPAELAGIYGSLQQLKQAMLLRMTINRMPVVADQTVFYDVELLVSLNGGVTWTQATEENFPAAGLTVILPYPEGTNAADFDFSVSHMFTVTSARLGTKAGEIETPAVNLRVEGIQVTLRGLSPVAVSWAKKETPAPTPTVTPVLTDVPKTGERANPALWIVMVLAGAAVIGALLIRSKKKHHR